MGMIDLIIKLIRRYRRFIIFCMGGGFGAIINWIISFILTSLIGVHYLISYSIALIINIFFNFLWNRHITFKVKDDVKKRFTRFILVSSFTALLSLGSMYIIKRYILDRFYSLIIMDYDLNYLAAIIIVTFIISVINYFFSNSWVFKNKKLN